MKLIRLMNNSKSIFSVIYMIYVTQAVNANHNLLNDRF